MWENSCIATEKANGKKTPLLSNAINNVNESAKTYDIEISILNNLKFNYVSPNTKLISVSMQK